MPNLGPMEILVVLMVALIVLGPKRLPEAGRQVGRAFGEIRRWSEGMQAEVRSVLDEDVEPPPPPPWTPPPAATPERSVSEADTAAGTPDELQPGPGPGHAGETDADDR